MISPTRPGPRLTLPDEGRGTGWLIFAAAAAVLLAVFAAVM